MEFRKKVRMRVRFVIRKARTNKQGLCPIDCRVRVNCVAANPFSTQIMVDPGKWDSKLQRIKGTSEKVLSNNRDLDEIKFQLHQCFDLHRAKGVSLSVKELIGIYNGTREYGCTLTQLSEKKIAELISLKRSRATIEIHKRCHKYLMNYLGEDLQANEVKRRHVSGLMPHLQKLGYDHDYVNKTVANCKSLFLFGIREGFVDESPFKGMKFTWENKVDLTCLTDEEKQRLLTTEWSPTLQRIVDSFIFMCFQGLHISDYIKLSSKDLVVYGDREWIKTSRTKTKVEATIPLHSESKKIIEKYGEIGNLPRISGQKSNNYLKMIGEKIGITKNLTNKVARKTFTDMCINSYQMSDESVASMLGHESTKYVRRYGAVRQNRILAEWKDK